MTVSPTRLIRKNVPLVACYVLALVPAVLWVPVVLLGVKGAAKGDSYFALTNRLRGTATRFETLASAIDRDKSSVLTPDHERKYSERAAELRRELEAAQNLLADRHRELERWFPDLPAPPDGREPSVNDFTVRLNTELDRLRRDHRAIVEDEGPTRSLFIALESPTVGSLRKAQRQFWILERVVEALEQGGTRRPGDEVPVRLCAPFEFAASSPVQPETPESARVQTVPFRFVVQMTSRDIPKVVRELLAQPIAFRVKSLHADLLPFCVVRPELGLTVNPEPAAIYDRPVYVARPGGADEVPADEESVLPEPKLRVTFELEAIDFVGVAPHSS